MHLTTSGYATPISTHLLVELSIHWHLKRALLELKLGVRVIESILPDKIDSKVPDQAFCRSYNLLPLFKGPLYLNKC